MDQIRDLMQRLAGSQNGDRMNRVVTFEEFLVKLREHPGRLIRNVHQLFHDMVRDYVGDGYDEYPDDPESINFIAYDFSPLLSDNTDQPFFADRIFANRLINMVEGFRGGTQQNKIYLFEGPPGSGKSIFLNNLLHKFEEYANSTKGCRYETVWRLDTSLLGDGASEAAHHLARLVGEERASRILDDIPREHRDLGGTTYVEVPCPSHDNPVLMVPRDQRPSFFDDLFSSDEFKWNLAVSKEYDWVFNTEPCTICSSLYQALLHKLDDPAAVFAMIHARPYVFNRRLGEGISVFNPGDRVIRNPVLTNAELQRRVSALLQDSNQVRYLFSRYARTNDGVFALMDLKGHNKERLLELHNIVSDGVHKVEELEERIFSLFLGVMNPEDAKTISSLQSLTDRIELININYVLDSTTEVAIYENTFGRHIQDSFLPRVLENFARVIIASRLNEKSPGMAEWIEDPEKYSLYCDKNLMLLKMSIYTGRIPSWLDEEDRKNFNARRRRKIIAEAETEGSRGFSGRESIDIFHDLYTNFGRDGQLITMDTLVQFFTKSKPELGKKLPSGFLDSLRNMYNYQTVQEVKESLFDYNQEQIARDLKNYLFALNFELGTTATCTFTGDKLEITETFLARIEDSLLGADAKEGRRRQFRADTQRGYTSRTLTQEIMVGGKDIADTELYQSLLARYVFHLKERVLEPFLGNANFRRALKDLGSEDFKTYDRKIQHDVRFLIRNLCDRFGYNDFSAREVCLYVIDHNLAEEFSDAG